MLSSIIAMLALTAQILVAAQQSGNVAQMASATQYAKQSVAIAQSLLGASSSVSVAPVQAQAQKTAVSQQAIERRATSTPIQAPILGAGYAPIVQTPKEVTIDFKNPTKEMKDYFYNGPKSLCGANFNPSAPHLMMALPQVDYTVQCDKDSTNGTIVFPSLDGAHAIQLSWLEANNIIPKTKAEFLEAQKKFSCEGLVSKVDAGTLFGVDAQYNICKSTYGL